MSNSTKITVVGGIYLEQCMRPHWDDYFGSGGRAAMALEQLGSTVALHGYADSNAHDCLEMRHAQSGRVELNLTPFGSTPSFYYVHGLSTPHFEMALSPDTIELEGDNVLRFGMVEGEAIVKAKRVVYDPQNPHAPHSFAKNGSEADRLAVVLNRREAHLLLGYECNDDEETVRLLAAQEDAEIIVMKRGPMGAVVYENGACSIVPAYKTKRVWKIGSGDVFAAVFALGWMEYDESAHVAAMRASKATAYYCEHKSPPTNQQLECFNVAEVEIGVRWKCGERFSVYLAGPFFSLAQLWIVEESRCVMSAMQLNVLSPYHQIGMGPAMDVVPKDLQFIKEADVMFALCDGLDSGTIFEIGYARSLGIPVVVLSEAETTESLKMMEGTNCIISDDFVSSMYHVVWAVTNA